MWRAGHHAVSVAPVITLVAFAEVVAWDVTPEVLATIGTQYTVHAGSSSYHVLRAAHSHRIHGPETSRLEEAQKLRRTMLAEIVDVTPYMRRIVRGSQSHGGQTRCRT